ncbi:hypothetical protein KSP40_PGU009452 [Platanthera guangdongensis]|uniref:Uncharacterized protein n=1 Tax=Platanthera guangdongensis TaxID=2320717 RepID=A0ABR2LG91_9ASPA
METECSNQRGEVASPYEAFWGVFQGGRVETEQTPPEPLQSKMLQSLGGVGCRKFCPLDFLSHRNCDPSLLFVQPQVSIKVIDIEGRVVENMLLFHYLVHVLEVHFLSRQTSYKSKSWSLTQFVKKLRSLAALQDQIASGLTLLCWRRRTLSSNLPATFRQHSHLQPLHIPPSTASNAGFQ